MWLRWLLSKLKLPCENSIKALCENQAAISNARNPIYHDRTKHNELIVTSLERRLNQSNPLILHSYTYQTAEILTKALGRVNFEELSFKVGNNCWDFLPIILNRSIPEFIIVSIFYLEFRRFLAFSFNLFQFQFFPSI